MYFYEVLVANKYATSKYTYSSSEIIEQNSLVIVEFGKSRCFGVSVGVLDSQENTAKIKQIERVFHYSFSSIFIDFIKNVASYNLSSIGSILEMSFGGYLQNLEKDLPFLPYQIEKDGCLVSLEEVFTKNIKYKTIVNSVNAYQKPFVEDKFIELTSDQAFCAEKINQAIETGLGKTLFVNGITGSGKTIVTLEGIASILNQSDQAGGKILIITPEISLGKMWRSIIGRRFGRESYFFHYKMSDNYKYNVFNWVNSDESGIIIGARSALFLPYKNLRAIIIDEEHSTSLKQDRYPYYHARDMAILRAHLEKIPCILLSATPSLETKYNVKIGKCEQLDILRTPSKGLAKFKFVKQEKLQILAPETIKAINEAFASNQQVLLFLNRKGYAPYCICNNCGNLLKCFGCDLPKIFYSNSYVMCHKCGVNEILPHKCKSCGQSTTWKFYGVGVEKLKEFVDDIFPKRIFKIVTSDTKEIDEYLDDIENKRIDGLIATQVLAQGHDFKNISLVVVVDADMGLNSPDFRSTERVLQLWQQIRGRSGRHECEGKFIIQGVSNDNKFIELFGTENAYENLMQERMEGNWPPFTRCAFIIMKSKDQCAIKDFCANEVFEKIKSMETETGVELFGPLYIGKERFVFEWRFLVKVSKNRKINEVMLKIIEELAQINKSIKAQMKKQGKKWDLQLEYEIDPYSFF